MDSDRQRIDKWLWFAHVVKSRSEAVRLVEDGYVRLNGQRVALPSRAVGTGDVLTIALKHHVRILRVLGLGARRGPRRDTCLLFEEIDPLRAWNRLLAMRKSSDVGSACHAKGK